MCGARAAVDQRQFSRQSTDVVVVVRCRRAKYLLGTITTRAAQLIITINKRDDYESLGTLLSKPG